ARRAARGALVIFPAFSRVLSGQSRKQTRGIGPHARLYNTPYNIIVINIEVDPGRLGATRGPAWTGLWLLPGFHLLPFCGNGLDPVTAPGYVLSRQGRTLAPGNPATRLEDAGRSSTTGPRARRRRQSGQRGELGVGPEIPGPRGRPGDGQPLGPSHR